MKPKPNVTPGFDNINSYIRARDARNIWFRKAALRLWRKLTHMGRAKKPNPLVLRGLDVG